MLMDVWVQVKIAQDGKNDFGQLCTERWNAKAFHAAGNDDNRQRSQ